PCTVEELLARAGLPVERTLWGRCPEDEGVPAYWPWTQALRGYVERAQGSALRAALGPAASEIARLVPAPRARGARLPDTGDAAPARSRFRLFDAVATFLQRLAAHELHVLVLDDVHWADDATML